MFVLHALWQADGRLALWAEDARAHPGAAAPRPGRPAPRLGHGVHGVVRLGRGVQGVVRLDRSVQGVVLLGVRRGVGAGD
ncbi:hypothetical protein, partial [Streptomyces sp. CBMA156]|uniref:hypothetical protein n=1 Tax=Streptomyces sp. CBMA156 TaxID=1930280 RepID=UPI0016620929